VGGMDVLFHGFEQQTFKDFELILVDNLYKYRKDQVTEYARQFSFPVKYVEPFNNIFPINAYQHSMNTGLVYANGKIAYLSCDFAWPQPNCLAEHAEFHQSTGFQHSMVGVFQIVSPPVPHEQFPLRYGWGEWSITRENYSAFVVKMNDPSSPEVANAAAMWADDARRIHQITLWADRYYQDLVDGKLDPFMISVYDNPVKSIQEMPIVHTEPKAHMLPQGFMSAGYSHLKNDSIPLDHLLAINGLDEDFDGCHCYQDSELAERLAIRQGMKHYFMPNNRTQIVDSHSLMGFRKNTRPEDTNAAIYNQKRSQGYAGPVNKWNLVQKRQIIRAT
jgi:hypothetical protein